MPEKVYVVRYHDNIIGVYEKEAKAHEGVVMHSMYYDNVDVHRYKVTEVKYFAS